MANAAIMIDLVNVGNAGNAADTTGYGAVSYDYGIGKYDVTVGHLCYQLCDRRSSLSNGRGSLQRERERI